MPLLSFQKPAVAALCRHFKTRQTVKFGERDIHPPMIVSASVSSGKSVMLAECAKAIRDAGLNRDRPTTIFILVIQRQGILCSQNSDAGWSIGLNNSIFSASCGNKKSTHYQVVYCTEGTVARALTQYRFAPWTEEELSKPPEWRASARKFHPDLILIDECFAPGVSIDGVPIEEIKVGDMVRSFNHTTNREESRSVARLYKSRPSTLCTVYLDDGRSFLCTENHPFFTQDNGYVSASCLESGSALASMHHVRQALFDGCRSQLAAVQGEGSGILLAGMRECLPVNACQHISSEDQPYSCIRAHDSSKPDVQGRDEKEGFRCAEVNRPQASSERREWIPSSGSADGNVRQADASRTSSGYGACCHGGGETRRRMADSLQTRCGITTDENMHGDGWREPFADKSKGAGCTEGSILNIARVDRIEIHQQTSDGKFGGLLPGGHVYNFEVEGNHNYFVNGILTHNCHQVPFEEIGTQYMKTLLHFYDCKPYMRLAGMTGSPFRGLSSIVGNTPQHLWRQVACMEPGEPDYPEGGVGNGIISTEFMINQGWVVAPMFGYPDDENNHYDFSHLSADQMEYSEAELDAAVVDKELCLAICADFVRKSRLRKGVLIFASTQRHTRQISAALKLLGISPDQIGIVIDSTTQKEQARILTESKAGNIKFVINVGVLTTGVNNSWWDTEVLMSPIKSIVKLIQAIGRILRLLIENDDMPMVERDSLTAELRKLMIAASGKPDSLVLDYGGVMDELGSLYENPVLEMAELEKAKKEGKELIECPKCMVDLGIQTMNSPTARRCIGMTGKDPLTGAAERCEHFWHFRLCPGCHVQNDQVARECRKCKRALIDPNAALSGKSYSDGESIPVQSMSIEAGRGGKLIVTFTLSDGRRPQLIFWPHAGKQPVINSKIWGNFVKLLPIDERTKWRISAMKASTIMENLELIPCPIEISARQNGKGLWTCGRMRFAEVAAETENFMEAAV